MQLFNQINARKLGDKEYNVFAGFFSNKMFLFQPGANIKKFVPKP